MLFAKRTDFLDLPIELIAKIIPPEDYSLHVPTALGIRIINNIPSHKRCKFVLQQLAGFSNKQVSDFARKYAPYVFVTSDLQISSHSHKKYIILELQELKNYEKSLSGLRLLGEGDVEKNTYIKGYKYLKRWMGDFSKLQYLWLPDYVIDNDSAVLGQEARINMREKMEPGLDLFVASMFSSSEAIALSRQIFENLTDLTLNLTVSKYLNLMARVKSLLTSSLLAPNKLQILFKVGPSFGNGTVLTEINRYRKSFPTGWITNFFSFQSLTAFTLHYYAPGTTIEYPRDFFKKLTKVGSINIAVWNFDVTMLSLVPHALQEDYFLQFKVALETYNQVKDVFHRGMWKVILESDKATFLNERGTKLKGIWG